MPGVDEFFPPVQYLPWWGLIGFGMLVVVVAWYVYVFWSTRSRAPVAVPESQFAARPSPEAVRARYVSLIEEARIAHDKGEADDRQTHHQLSLLLRSFVAEREGVRTLPMTLADLRETPLTPLTKAVEQLYPGAFSASHRGSVDQAIAEARRVVTTWN